MRLIPKFALVYFLCATVSSAGEGAASGGGDFEGRNAHRLLDLAIEDLLSSLDRMSDSELTPDRKSLVRETLETSISREEEIVVIDPTTGKSLVMDYQPRTPTDAAPKQIRVLKPFFHIYDQAPELFNAYLPEVKRRLLHEISHLWDLGVIDDAESSRFAERVIPLGGFVPLLTVEELKNIRRQADELPSYVSLSSS